MGFTPAQLATYRDATVPDLAGPGLRLLFVGINPGLWTAAAQAHFARRGNRFYPALYRAGILDRVIDASAGYTAADHAYLLERGIGITNVVARATARADELDRDELVAGGQALAAKVAVLQPSVVAILGVTAYRVAFARPKAVVGQQAEPLSGVPLWVVPNPSGLNAHSSLDSLAVAYRAAASGRRHPGRHVTHFAAPIGAEGQDGGGLCMLDCPRGADSAVNPAGAAGSAPVSLWSLAPSTFLPAFVYEIGNGAIAPINALTAISCGASPEVAAFMLALPPIGQVLGDLPSSALANRVGDRRAMMFAAGGAVIALMFCFLARSLFVLGPGLLLVGLFNSTYYLGRQSYMIDVVPLHMRARAMSTLGGSHRIGLFCGPFLGAAAHRADQLPSRLCPRHGVRGRGGTAAARGARRRAGRRASRRPPRGDQSLRRRCWANTARCC